MTDINEFKETPMGKALVELSSELKKHNIPPVSINVIGGFALMLNGVRESDGVTDIDYVGDTLPDNFNQIADKIGIKHGLGRGWINNDVMLSDNTLEDFEFATGKLHFDESVQINNININILNEEDILRMKLIAIDTSLMAAEDGGDFSRIKDLSDITKLLDRQRIDYDSIADIYYDYIMDSKTPEIIKQYQTGGNKKVLEYLDNIRSEHDAYVNTIKNTMQTNTQRTPFMENLLDKLMSKSKTTDSYELIDL